MIKKLLLFILIFITFPILSLADNQFPSFPMAFWGTATIDGQPLLSGTEIKAFCDNNLIGEVTMLENGIYGYADSTKVKLLVGNCSGDILFKYLLSGATNPLTGGSEIKYTSGFEEGKTVNKNLEFINTRSCSITNGTGSQIWSELGWGNCPVVGCNTNYHQENNSCISNSRSCSISNGTGNQIWNNNVWGDCAVLSCNAGYHQSSNSCVADSSGGGGGGNTPVTVTPTTTKKGDANGDNKVDKYDFALMMANWGKTGTNTSDLNNDGKVDKYDFALLMLNWSI